MIHPPVQQSWIASLLAVALVLGCAEAPPPPRGRVLVVGIDGASMRVIEPMIAAGRLPNLAALAREGASGKLRSLEPLLSPRVWTSVVTSRTAGASSTSS